MERERLKRILQHAENLRGCGIEPARAHYRSALVEIDRMESDLARLRRVESAARDLAEKEALYRKAHDLSGDDSLAAGRAWDVMRRAGDALRAALADVDAGGEG